MSVNASFGQRLLAGFRTTVMTSTAAKHTNQLANQRSPYLLQHAHNPVDWYPWGKEAFAKAKETNKLIFLSVGYSTCHWCHVMERESFESEQIAAIMNDLFVNVKVDREERPDVDKTYMTFIQALSGGGGGWPMSVWLTPDLKPVTGGTYFPPTDGMGRPGFATILHHVNKQWVDRRDDVLKSSEGISSSLQKAYASLGQIKESTYVPNMHTVSEACYNYYHKSWDPRWGGFGDAPKFPQPANLEFLLHYHKRDVNGQLNKRALTMLDKTLTRMAMGGIYDHVMQGFHRYSTDGRWHVPHFEKMLYDQAQLAVIYADTFDVTNNQLFEDILKGILTYVDRDLSHPLGGFYSAEDADSLPTAEDKEKREGAFCVWSWEELQTLLSATVPDSEKKLVDVFVHYYNCKIVGNTNPDLDPHGELIGQNVLIVYEEAEKTADELDLTTKQVTDALKQSRKILAEKRLTRPPPHLDTKIMTAWNGLMISGFAKASSVLAGKGKPDISAKYRQRASKAAEFLQKFSAGENGRLLRCVYATKRGDQEVHQIENPVLGFADDYAFLIQGILDLIECSETSDKDRWLKWALQLQRQMDELFWDEANDATYYLNTDDDESILIRLKDDHDGAEPCINSVATHNLIRLSRHLKESDPALSKSMVHKCRRIFLAFEQRLNKTPFVVPKMVCALVDFEQVKSVE